MLSNYIIIENENTATKSLFLEQHVNSDKKYPCLRQILQSKYTIEVKILASLDKTAARDKLYNQHHAVAKETAGRPLN